MADPADTNPFQAPTAGQSGGPGDDALHIARPVSSVRFTVIGTTAGVLFGSFVAALLGALASLYVSPDKSEQAVAFAALGAPLGFLCGLFSGPLIGWRLGRRVNRGLITAGPQLRGRAALLAGFAGLAFGALAASILPFTLAEVDGASGISRGAQLFVALISLLAGAAGGAVGGWLLGARLAREL